MIQGKMKYYCRRCRRWNDTHATASHVEGFGKGDAKSGQANHFYANPSAWHLEIEELDEEAGSFRCEPNGNLRAYGSRHPQQEGDQYRQRCQEPFVYSTRRTGSRQTVPDTFFAVFAHQFFSTFAPARAAFCRARLC